MWLFLEKNNEENDDVFEEPNADSSKMKSVKGKPSKGKINTTP